MELTITLPAFNINSDVFVATANRSNLSNYDADKFTSVFFGRDMTIDLVEEYVENYATIQTKETLAQALVDHLFFCNNVGLDEAIRRGF